MTRENVLVKRVTSTEVLEGGTQNAGWECAPGVLRPDPQPELQGEARTKARCRAEACVGRKDRLAGSGVHPKHVEPIARAGHGLRRQTEQKTGQGDFVLFLDFAKSKEFGKLWKLLC